VLILPFIDKPNNFMEVRT